MNQRWQGWRWLLAVLAVAMLPRIAYLGWQAHTGAIRWEDGAHQEYLRAASGLTRNGAMGDCYSFTGNVFAYAARSPILPLLLAGFQRLGLDPILWGKLAAGLAGVIGVALSGVFCGVMAERYDPRLSQPAAARPTRRRA